MGTDLENVLEDIEALKQHLEYFVTCRGIASEAFEEKIRNKISEIIEIAKEISDK